MIAVIDTSALMRLIIPDGPIPSGLDAFMRGAERGEHEVAAPDLMWVEAANVLNKKRRHGILTEEEARQALGLLLRMPITSLAHLSAARPSIPAVAGSAERRNESFVRPAPR